MVYDFCNSNFCDVSPHVDSSVSGSWDERGIGTRHVVHHEGAMWMIFEGVNADTVHSLGLVSSPILVYHIFSHMQTWFILSAHVNCISPTIHRCTDSDLNLEMNVCSGPFR